MPSCTTTAYQRHLFGWLLYAFASEVFVIVSLTLFLPICLEQFARDNGFLLPDKTLTCVALAPPVGPTLLTSLSNVTAIATVVGTPESRCVVKLGWLWVDTASFSLYVYSISVALQALTVISMGGIADHPPNRKRLLIFFALLGSLSAISFLFLPSTSPLWPLCAPLAMFANVGFGASIVAMNAYLPLLAREAPEVVELRTAIAEETNKVEGVESESRLDSEFCGTTAAGEESEAHDQAPLLLSHHQHQNGHSQLNGEGVTSASSPSSLKTLRTKYEQTLSSTTARISSQGIAIGYISGIVLLCFALIPVTRMHGSTFALRVAIGASGLWWAGFTVPAAFLLPGIGVRPEACSVGDGDEGVVASDLEGLLRDGGVEVGGEDGWGEDPLNPTRRLHRKGVGELDEDWSMRREIGKAWVRLMRMLRWSEITKLRNTFRYLAAWFLLSDGFTTITSTALLFAKTSLSMPSSSLILIGILTPLSGILGSLLWPKIQSRLGWSNLRVLISLIVLASLIPMYGCLGFFFEGKAQDNGAEGTSTVQVKFGGLTTPGEMYALAVVFGVVYGAFQGYARAFYAELIPPGEEARWYGLFSITDKSSSFIGPLVVGLIADMTGNIRYAFFFLSAMIWAALPILAKVDVEQGRKDARRYRYE